MRKIIGVAIVSILVLCSCSSIKNVGYNITNHKKLKNANAVINTELESDYIPALTIIDKEIHSQLDSIIQLVVDCNNYSSKLKNLFSFTIQPYMEEESFTIRYKFFPELSLKRVMEHKKNIVGGFSYDNHFFIVRHTKDIEEADLELFYEHINCDIKIFLWDFEPNKLYMPYAIVEKNNNQYQIINENLCGNELYVTGE